MLLPLLISLKKLTHVVRMSPCLSVAPQLHSSFLLFPLAHRRAVLPHEQDNYLMLSFYFLSLPCGHNLVNLSLLCYQFLSTGSSYVVSPIKHNLLNFIFSSTYDCYFFSFTVTLLEIVTHFLTSPLCFNSL